MKWILSASALLGFVSAHSWLECTSYNPISFNYLEIGNFDRSRCSGYPRRFQTQFSKGFGIDTGYDNERMVCRENQFNPTDYSAQIPMATYAPGQTIYLSHPAKNHVANNCTLIMNPNIQSLSMNVWMSSRSNIDLYDIKLMMVGPDHVNGVIDHMGFQRCYNFCANPDLSHCLTAWVLPSEVIDGRYSFMWKWEFNPGQFYTNCFDAMIISNTATSPMPTPSLNISNSSETVSPIDMITIPPATQLPTPTTSSPTTSTPTTSTPTPSPTTPSPTTPSPTMPINTAEVITSGSSSVSNPLVKVVKYLINMTGFMNMTVIEESLP